MSAANRQFFKKTKRGKKKGQVPNRFPKQKSPLSPLLQLSSAPFPLQTRRWLPYIEDTIIIQGAAQFLILERIINNPFDPNPAVGGISASGFGTYAAAYGSYHVEKAKFRYSVANNEGFGVQFGIILRDGQPSGTITTVALATAALGISPSTGRQTIAQATGNSLYPRTPWMECDPGAVIGNQRSYMSEIDYTASTTASPAQSVWLAFIVISPAANLTNGVFLNLEIEFMTRFYSLLNAIP